MSARAIRRLSLTVVAVVASSSCGGGSDTGDTTPVSSPEITDAPTTEPPDSTTAPTTVAATTPPPATESPTTTTATETTTPPPDTSIAEPTTATPTIDELLAMGRPLNLAHAGGDQAAPHSTMFAFRSAVEAGVDVLELDVQLTSDGVLIVQHDDTVDKTTNTTGPVADLTLAEIQALDNGYWFSPQCWPCQDRPIEEYIYRGMRTGDVAPPDGFGPDDFRVLTFEELATTFPEMPLDIEIKGTFPDALPVAEVLAAEIEALDRTDSTVVVAFDDQLVDAFHELAPDVAVSPGLTRLTEWFLSGTEVESYFQIFQVPPFQAGIQVVNADTVQRIHDEGRVVWVWPDDASTQENAEFYREMLDLGVDGIIGGRPGVVSDTMAAG